MKSFSKLAALMITTFVSVQTVHSAIAVSNLGQTNSGISASIGETSLGQPVSWALGLVTGNDPLGYSLESVTLNFLSPGGFAHAGNTLGDLDIELFDSNSGSPGGVIAAFGVNNPNTGGEFTFPLVGGFSLSPGTEYFVVASAPNAMVVASGQATYFWEYTRSTDEDAGGLADWSINDNYFRANVLDPSASNSWISQVNEFNPMLQVDASAVPEPASSALILCGISGLILLRRRATKSGQIR